MKNILRQTLPPAAHQLARAIRRRIAPPQESLFDGNGKTFTRLIEGARFYAEYGCGLSTIHASEQPGLRTFSVDTSSEWIERVSKKIPRSANVRFRHVDLGELGDWGWPKSYDRMEFFPDYTEAIWRQDQKPDLILIDGRFRVCCFLTALLRAEQGTTILFDDYRGRPKYHVVERFLKPDAVDARQARFTVPDFSASRRAAIEKSVEQFRMVMD
jgi:hypothetical protein